MMNQRSLQKVLMTADTIGGVWGYTLDLVKALQSHKVEVHLATMGEKLSASQWEEVRQLANVSVYESEYALEWMEHPWDEVEQAGGWLLGLEQQIQPDIIHLNNYVHAALSWDAPVLVVGHSCVLSWWQSVKKEAVPEKWHTYHRRVKEGIQSADYLVGITETMLEYLDQFYGPLPASGVIYNARESDIFSPGPKETCIFSMGRLWDEAKNIQAVQIVAGKLPWPVYVAGEDHGQMQSAAENMRYLGRLNKAEVAEQLGKSSIYILPARYEPFGLSALEAALSGCALILGDIPSLREVWGDAALYADPDDTAALEDQVVHLISNPGLRDHMTAKAMKRAKRYTISRMGQQYMETYQLLIKQNQLSV